MKKNVQRLNAVKLRIILSASLVLIIAVAAMIVYLANTQLREVATIASNKAADATASDDAVFTLERIQKKLNEEKGTIERVNSIVADSQSYQYQNQIISDLNDYASKASITITNLDFSAGNTTASTPGAPSPALPATPDAAAVAPATTGGLKSTSVSVTLANPVNYNNLLRFIRLIEQNLTKMQISKVNLTKEADATEVNTETFTIDVYIR